MASLARSPELFERLLAVHAREAPVAHLGLAGPLRLALGLLRNGRAPHASQCVR